MTLITQNKTFTIPANLQENSFVISLLEQSLTKELSTKQIQTLMDILDMPEDEPKYETQTIKRYKRSYFKIDHHGDPLQVSESVYDISEDNLNNKIQDIHALQYGSEAYVTEYTYIEDIEIPAKVTNIGYFMSFFYEDYKALSEKVQRNKFRKIKSKNLAYRALQSLVQGNVAEVNESLIYIALGKRYSYENKNNTY